MSVLPRCCVCGHTTTEYSQKHHAWICKDCYGVVKGELPA